jgi:hypothetical protein
MKKIRKNILAENKREKISDHEAKKVELELIKFGYMEHDDFIIVKNREKIITRKY